MFIAELSNKNVNCAGRQTAKEVDQPWMAANACDSENMAFGDGW